MEESIGRQVIEDVPSLQADSQQREEVDGLEKELEKSEAKVLSNESLIGTGRQNQRYDDVMIENELHDNTFGEKDRDSEESPIQNYVNDGIQDLHIISLQGINGLQLNQT